MQHAGLDLMLGAVEGLPVQPMDLQASGLLIADAVACMAGAQAVPASQPVMQWAHKQPRSAQTSALVLAALSNVLEMDAMHVASSVHPGTVVVPAALAVAMAVGASGPDLARAVLRGTEAAIRLGRSTGTVHRQRFQSTATCGGIGAALACADLLGLTRGQSLDAMGHVTSVAGGLWAFLEEDTMTKQWHAGKAAEAAVLSAQLAAEGLRGAHRALDGKRGFLAVLCDGGNPSELGMLRERWQIHDTAYKPWPSPRPTHAAITAALNARLRIGDAAIDRVMLRTFGMALDLCNRQPVVTAHDARFSLRYCTALALADGAIGFDSFEPPEIARHAALVTRIEVREDAGMTAAYPQCSQASVEITLANGTTVIEHVDHALGDPELPLSDQARLMKHRALLARACIPAESALRNDIETIATARTNPAYVLDRAFHNAGLRFLSAAAATEHTHSKEPK
jgi:2-methylcitrate dehydratase PrpD